MAGALALPAATVAAVDGYELIRGLMSEDRGERRAAGRRLAATGDRAWLAPLADALFFIPGERRKEAVSALEALSGERGGSRYLEWVEVVGRARPPLPPGYLGWKRELLAKIDPRYRAVFYDGAPALIRLEEIVWGGVRLDGIPSIDQPTMVPAAEAGYLEDGERVFGVFLDGEARAYPLRQLSWHEMLNDTVAGRPVTLSYCTLCGSGVLFDTRTVRGSYTFGTSGLLYRSNKLMYDRNGFSLWSNLTGEAVVGRAAQAARSLPVLPMTLTRWGEWRRRHPATLALALDRDTERRWGFRYQPGAADQARRGVEFPVWRRSDRLDRQAEVYALRVAGAAKAYPLERLRGRRVVNDRVGEQAVVLVVEDGGGVRAYRRPPDLELAAGEAGVLVDDGGGRWRVEEQRLEPDPPADDLEPLARLPGHVAFWFGWFGFYPDTEVWDG